MPHTARLLARCPGWSEAQRLLDVLSDRHRAENVEEYKAAVCHVVSQQVPVAQTLHPVDGSEGKLGHNTSVKDGVEHGEERGEGKT